MGIFDIFTGKPQQDAAAQQRAYFDQLNSQTQANIGKAQTQGLDLLQAGQTGALGQLGAGTTQARTDIQGSLDPALSALYAGQTQGADALNAGQTGGLAALQSGVGSAVSSYDPLAAAATRYGDAGSAASTMSANALGLNGPGGVQSAQNAFQAGPGYGFAVDQGLEAIMRNANVGGGAAGGNVLRESQTFGQGLANQEFNNWLKNLQSREALYNPLEANALGQVGSGRSNAYLTGGTGAANIYTGTGGRLSDLYSGTGKAGAGIYGQTGQSLADLASKGGLAGAGIYSDTAGRQAALLGDLTKTGTNFSGQLAPAYGKTYSDAAAAQTSGNQNLWNLIGGAAKLAVGFA